MKLMFRQARHARDKWRPEDCAYAAKSEAIPYQHTQGTDRVHFIRGYCEGYALVSTKKKASGPAQICWDAREIVQITVSPKTEAQLDTSTLDFRDEVGMLYFNEFVGLFKGTWTSAASSGDLWGVTLPQLARSNRTLRCAAMAIGALSVWYSHSPHASLRAASVPVQSTVGGDAHYFRAVALYCDSLKLQRQRASVQDTIFLSVLLLFFEMLRGNRRAALDHVNHALSLLLDLMTDADVQRHLADLAPNPTPVLGEVAGLFNHLGRQARSVFRGRMTDGMSLPNLRKGLRLKRQTMESFMVLLSQLPSASSVTSTFPTVMNSLDEYERFWPVVRREQVAMNVIIGDAIQKSSVVGTEDEGVINQFHLDLLSNPRIKRYCENFKETMDRLDVVFKPLFESIVRGDIESPTYLRAILLRSEYIGVYLFNNPPSYVDVHVVSSLTPLFREYLSLCQIAIRAARLRAERNPAHHLSLQCGLAWNLCIISMFSREPTVRDEAVWMLREYPGQDGLWNTGALYALALRNRYVERENAVEGTPEEQWTRLWRREFVFEDGGDRILLRYMERDTLAGGWHLVEEVANIQGEGEDAQWIRQPITGKGGLLMLDIWKTEIE
ncbi:hypothetical protein CCHL11_00400 [Colletotrichum chlorophyti]|uniref:C6 zinc finger domain protein n=1 Tax=Colletotrichum chlorophyti TaxID=708187 RepID=A0A1Q8RV69_9PEZI|nr:hypothetical protein CCHL11_00400 [Colletotrichum chlorophyti]